jgi:hypothetical protein
MQFSKEFLTELCDNDEYVHTEPAGDSRWLEYTRAIFRHNGSLYQTTFARGKTEMQECRPYEYDPDLIECDEVQLVTEVVEVTRYRKVSDV